MYILHKISSYILFKVYSFTIRCAWFPERLCVLEYNSCNPFYSKDQDQLILNKGNTIKFKICFKIEIFLKSIQFKAHSREMQTTRPLIRGAHGQLIGFPSHAVLLSASKAVYSCRFSFFISLFSGSTLHHIPPARVQMLCSMNFRL